MAGEIVKYDPERAARIQRMIDELSQTAASSKLPAVARKALPAASDKYMDLALTAEKETRLVLRRDFVADRLDARKSVPPPLPHGAWLAATPAPPRRIDVMRKCVTHDLSPWAAIYLLQADGSYKYSQSVRATPELRRGQYAPGTQKLVELDPRWLDEETCAVCGAAGVRGFKGSFKCGNCGPVCGGLSNGLYFRCCCGAEGWARPMHIDNWGIAL